MLNDIPVSGGPDLAPRGHCKYLLSNKSTFLKFMFKTREKGIGSQREHLLGGAKEGGMYHRVQEQREGVCDGTITET